MAALQIKNIPWGAGDDIKMDASWAKGDTKNVIATNCNFAELRNVRWHRRSGAYQSIGFGATTEAVWLPTVQRRRWIDPSDDRFGFRGAYNHNWDPYWSSSLFGSYSAVRYDGTAKVNICSDVRGWQGRRARTTVCNPDFNVSQLGVVTRWTPVKNLTFSAEVQWFHLDQKFTGTATLTATAPKPTARYEYKDQDTYYLERPRSAQLLILT